MKRLFKAVLMVAVLVGVTGTQVRLAHADCGEILLQELMAADLDSDMVAAFQTTGGES